MAEITFLELETGPNPTYSVIWMHGLGGHYCCRSSRRG
jgi:predicted esterase